MSEAIYQMGRRHTLTVEFLHTKKYFSFYFKSSISNFIQVHLYRREKLRAKKMQINIFYLTENILVWLIWWTKSQFVQLVQFC